MFSGFIYHVACVRNPFLFKTIIFYACIDHILFIHLFIDGHMAYIYSLAMVNNASINMMKELLLLFLFLSLYFLFVFFHSAQNESLSTE